MSFEGLIALLAGWVGRRVTVTVAGDGEPSVTAAAFEGVHAAPD